MFKITITISQIIKIMNPNLNNLNKIIINKNNKKRKNLKCMQSH
jgi:hypothetical protein